MRLIKKKEVKAKRFVTLPSPHRLREKLIKEEIVDLVPSSEQEIRPSYKDVGSLGDITLQRSKDASPYAKPFNKSYSEQHEEMIKKLENLKKQEIARLFKSNMTKNLDERQQEYLNKVFRYAFTKRECEELLSKFVKEKRVMIRLLI